MITHITGHLLDVAEESVTLERDGIGYTIMTPKYAIGELAGQRGREVTLHTILFIDNSQNGSSLEPRLIGFPNPEDRLFFRRFISVKGIGSRKALNALSYPAIRVAGWIEQGDTKALTGLPGIGKRAAELIVAELRGKLQDLALAGATVASRPECQLSDTQRDALDIMVALGDGRNDAETWLQRANSDDDSAEAWVRAAYKVKTGVHSS
jgi:holliday junction DNA helicase RuvA